MYLVPSELANDPASSEKGNGTRVEKLGGLNLLNCVSSEKHQVTQSIQLLYCNLFLNDKKRVDITFIGIPLHKTTDKS